MNSRSDATPPAKDLSQGQHTLRTGLLALGSAAFLFLGLTLLNDEVLSKVRDIELSWGNGRFASPSFWIQWPGSYDFDLDLPDTAVPTRDEQATTLGRRWIRRCGQPFPAGFKWTVRRYERVVAQRTLQTRSWCGAVQAAGESSRLSIGVGVFQASPGPGYSLTVEAVDANGSIAAGNAPPPPLRLTLSRRTDWGEFIPAGFVSDLLILLGAICVPLGLVLLALERMQKE